MLKNKAVEEKASPVLNFLFIENSKQCYFSAMPKSDMPSAFYFPSGSGIAYRTVGEQKYKSNPQLGISRISLQTMFVISLDEVEYNCS